MFGDTKAYSGLAASDLAEARKFYEETLGIRTSVLDEENGLVTLHLAGDRDTLLYETPGATPASFTVLNFPVEDVDEAVDALTERGVTFERYEGAEQDERGIMHGPGPHIAWFKDPTGNVLSVHSED